MNKLILSLLGIFSLFSLHAQVCGTETFTSANLTATYADGSYVGDNGVTWTYVHSRDESTYGITGKGIMLRRQSSSSKLTSSSVSGGIADFTCSLRKAFTGAGNRQVELFVNNISVVSVNMKKKKKKKGRSKFLAQISILNSLKLLKK